MNGQGQRRRSEREATAYHEAGHAVASFYLGRGVREVSIIHDVQHGTLGRVRNYRLPAFRPEMMMDARTRTTAERCILILLAGPEAERRYKGRSNQNGACYDRDAVADLAGHVCCSEEEADAYLCWLSIRTRGLLAVPSLWAAVKALAAELLSAGRLSGTNARSVYSSALAQAAA
jgi:hypothetical protein